MNKIQRQTVVALLITLGMIAIDQLIKVAVKTGMYMHQSIRVTDWFYLLFTENNGMAFGWEFMNKYFLTSFRILFTAAIIAYLIIQIRRGTKWSYLVCLSLIVSGALGNIIDCVFYGMIFNDPIAPEVAHFVSLGSGYAPVLLGRVVDMFYFPLVEWTCPTWMPVLSGQHFIFFSPIFNFADACISVGIGLLLLFHRKEIMK